jgi:alpha-beta hydrolase superfamily lysophospholipase
MNHIEGNFIGVRSASIYYQGWLPAGPAKAIIIIAHGLGEHSGRYMNVVNHFVPLGCAIYGLDHIGHGKSDGDREVINRFTDFTDNLTVFYHMVIVWQAEKPIFLLGHSLGGLIAAFYLIDQQSNFKGAIISAPMTSIPENISPVTVTLGRILSALVPKAGIIGLDATGVSRDPEVVKAYVNDPLVFHGKTPARLAAEMLVAIQRVTAEANKITLPFITLQGTADKLVNPNDAKHLYEIASSKDKTLKTYPGLYHEVFNEPERTVVLKDVETWLFAHL